MDTTTHTAAGVVADLTGTIGVMAERTIAHTIPLHRDGDTTTQLNLRVWHSPGLKAFLGRVEVTALVERGAYSVTKSQPYEQTLNVILPGKRTPRYSAAGLMAYRSECLAALVEDPTLLDPLDLSPFPADS